MVAYTMLSLWILRSRWSASGAGRRAGPASAPGSAASLVDQWKCTMRKSRRAPQDRRLERHLVDRRAVGLLSVTR